MANELTYQEGQTPLDSNLRPIKVGDKNSPIELSEDYHKQEEKLTFDNSSALEDFE